MSNEQFVLSTDKLSIPSLHRRRFVLQTCSIVTLKRAYLFSSVELQVSARVDEKSASVRHRRPTASYRCNVENATYLVARSRFKCNSSSLISKEQQNDLKLRLQLARLIWKVQPRSDDWYATDLSVLTCNQVPRSKVQLHTTLRRLGTDVLLRGNRQIGYFAIFFHSETSVPAGSTGDTRFNKSRVLERSIQMTRR